MSDMHLKNFSLINQPGMGYVLSSAYDMVATSLIVKGDNEELALHLNGKRNKIKRMDFDALFDSFMIEAKSKENIFKKFHGVLPKWLDLIGRSFLPQEMKNQYVQLIEEKATRIV